MRSATAVVLCAGVQVAAAFSAPGATLPLRGGRCAASAAAAHAGGPSVQMVAASDVPVSRRAVLSEAVGAGLILGAAAAPAGAKEAKAKAGAWAKHDGEFTEKELDGFTETKSGLLYKDIDEGTGVVPQPGQKIKAHCEWGHMSCAPARPRARAPTLACALCRSPANRSRRLCTLGGHAVTQCSSAPPGP